MARGGHNAKPIPIRKMQGNPGKRPINPNAPESAPLTTLAPPSELDRYGKLAWRRNARKLARMGLLQEADADMLMIYCDAYSQWRDARDGMDRLNSHHMPTTESDDEKQELVKDILKSQREYQITREKARADMRLIAGELGLSASSRSRLSVTTEKPDVDPMESLLSGRRSG